MTKENQLNGGFGFSFRPLLGYGYGLRQKILTGKISLRVADEARLINAVELVAGITGESSFGNNNYNASELGAVEKIIYLYLRLQQYANIPVFDEYVIRGSGPAGSLLESASSPEVHNLVLPYWDPAASKIVLEWIATVVNQPNSGETDTSLLIQKLKRFTLHGTNPYPFVKAAWELNLHYEPVYDRIIQFGVGSQSCWLESSLTEFVSGIAARLAKDKSATNTILKRLGFPVPRQLTITGKNAANAIKAKPGFPIVIKPAKQDQGKGVAVDLKTDEQITQAFDTAFRFGPRVIVEEYLEGADYRLTVFRDSVVKVLKRVPLSITGDGISSIFELLEARRCEPMHARNVLLSDKNPFEIDEEIKRVLSEQGLVPSQVPANEQVIYLRKISNISAGGRQELISLSEIHPDNLTLAVESAKALRLDLCGVDLLIHDISKSWREIGGWILELNVQPQIGSRLAPETYSLILRDLINGPAPTVLLLITPATHHHLTPQHSAICNILINFPKPALVVSGGKLWLDELVILESIADRYSLVRAALQHKRAHTILFIFDAGEVIRNGLPTHSFNNIYWAAEKSSAHDSKMQRDILNEMIGKMTLNDVFL